MENATGEGSPKEVWAGRVEWPTDEGLDALELLFYGTEGTNPVQEIRDRIGLNLCLEIDTAVDILCRSEMLVEQVEDEEVDANGNELRLIGWVSPADNVAIRVRTLYGPPTKGEEEPALCKIDGQMEWVSGLAQKLVLDKGTAELFIAHDQKLGDNEDSPVIVLSHRFLIPDLEKPGIEWVESTPSLPTVAEGSEDNPLKLITAYLNLEDASPTGFAEVDDFYAGCALSKLRAQLIPRGDGTFQIVGEEDVVVEFSKELKRVAKETVNAAFDTLESIEDKRGFQASAVYIEKGPGSASAVGMMSARNARNMLKEAYETDDVDDFMEFGLAITHLAELASLRGDLPSVLEYCRIVEMLPPEDCGMYLAMCYFAASRLEDADCKAKLASILDDEKATAFAKRADDPEYTFDLSEDRPMLMVVVGEFEEYNMSPDKFIDDYTSSVMPGEEVEIDEESRWNLRYQCYTSRRDIRDDDDVSELIDGLLSSMVDEESMDRFDSAFAWNTISEVFEDVTDVEIKYKMVRRFIEISNDISEDQMLNFGVFNSLSVLAYAIIDDENFTEAHPEIPDEMFAILTTVADRIREVIDPQGEIKLTEALMHYQILIGIMVEDKSAEDIIVSIEAEEERRKSKVAAIIDELDSDDELIEAQLASNHLRARAAASFSIKSKFRDSKMLISGITDPNIRNGIYVSNWFRAKDTGQVQQLMPLEVESSQEFYEEDDPDSPDPKGRLASLYATALITAGGDLESMVSRAREVSGMIADDIEYEVDEDEQPEDVGDEEIKSNIEFTNARYSQLGLLLLKIRSKDKEAARLLAMDILPQRLSGPKEFVDHESLIPYYLALREGTWFDSLELTRSSIATNPTESDVVRAGLLADFAKEMEIVQKGKT